MQPTYNTNAFRPTVADLAVVCFAVFCLVFISILLIPVIRLDRPYGVLYEVIVCIAAGIYIFSEILMVGLWFYHMTVPRDDSPQQTRYDIPSMLFIGSLLLTFVGCMFIVMAMAVLLVSVFV